MRSFHRLGRACACAFALAAALSCTQAASAQAAPGQLIISEFRLGGYDPDFAGPVTGANDEFIEIYNTTGQPFVVLALDASAGFAVAASDGVVRCVVPNATLIPAGGHFLCANTNPSGGYTLGGYPAGPGTTATPDATYTLDIPLNAGVALFRTANPLNFSAATRLDAVGSTSEPNALYREGAGYVPLNPVILPNQATNHTLYRDLCNFSGATNRCAAASPTANDYGGGAGRPKDTGDNAADFIFTDVGGADIGSGPNHLGAPGPENLSSPVLKSDAQVTGNLVDSTKSSSQPPNRVRDLDDPAGNNGALDIRRRYQNNTGAPVTRLRFRIVYITGNLRQDGSYADVRARSTPSDITVTNVEDPATCAPNPQPCSVTVRATTLEQPPTQFNGGGFNSSWGVAIPGGSLAPGASISVNFKLGVIVPGIFRILLNVEGLP